MKAIKQDTMEYRSKLLVLAEHHSSLLGYNASKTKDDLTKQVCLTFIKHIELYHWFGTLQINNSSVYFHLNESTLLLLHLWTTYTQGMHVCVSLENDPVDFRPRIFLWVRQCKSRNTELLKPYTLWNEILTQLKPSSRWGKQLPTELEIAAKLLGLNIERAYLKKPNSVIRYGFFLN